jgi:hypothetical protein
MTIGGIGTVGEREARKKKRRNAGSFAGVRFAQGRMINYIVFGGRRSRIRGGSRRTQILGILKVWAGYDGRRTLHFRQNQ